MFLAATRENCRGNTPNSVDFYGTLHALQRTIFSNEFIALIITKSKMGPDTSEESEFINYSSLTFCS